MTIDVALQKLTSLLYGVNYSVSLRRYEVSYSPEQTAEDYIRLTFGPTTVIGGLSPIDVGDMLAEIEAFLRYGGDEHSGPSQDALQSATLTDLIASDLTLNNAPLKRSWWRRSG